MTDLDESLIVDEELAAKSDALEVTFAMVDAAEDFRELAAELRAAAAHADRAADHMIAGDLPRATSHAFAAHGHMRRAERVLGERAEDHAERSQ